MLNHINILCKKIHEGQKELTQSEGCLKILSFDSPFTIDRIIGKFNALEYIEVSDLEILDYVKEVAQTAIVDCGLIVERHDCVVKLRPLFIKNNS